MNRPEARYRTAAFFRPASMPAILSSVLLWSSLAWAQQPSGNDTEAVPAESVGAVVACVVCHGAEGQGNTALGAPRIGGLADWYLARQLRNFRTGVRGNTDQDVFGTQMRAMTLALEDMAALEEMARYFATLEPAEAPTSISGDPAHGKQLYAVCAACHGPEGAGNKSLNAPALKGQYDWYLVRQLKNYSQGIRGGSPDDTYGQQMAPIVKTLSEKDIRDVVAYINTF